MTARPSTEPAAGRIGETFQRLSAEGRKALLAFITAGDPTAEATIPAMHALVAGGADILELGVPFSDPEAEGPVIQASSERALAAGMTLSSTFDLVARFRENDATTPVVLMGYLNPLLTMGIGKVAERARTAGADGFIVVNLPPEEAELVLDTFADAGLALIFLVAPTTTPQRRTTIAANGSGFIYYVSLKGITGADHIDADSVAANVDELRTHTSLPIVVGFGIKDGASARGLGRRADGVVVGSALVRTMAEHPTDHVGRLREQVREIRGALDA